MSTPIPAKLNLNQIITKICDQLLAEHKLITIKNVRNLFFTLYPLNTNEYSEENFISSINSWRIYNLNNSYNDCNISNKSIPNNKLYNNLHEENNNLKKELFKYKRKIQFLQAKIQSLNSCYNRQRKEFILKLQRMLYQANIN